MKQNINLHDFRQAFHNMGRGDQFSYEALEVIFDWIEEYDRDNGSESELDVIGLCCEIAESSIEQIISDYSIDCDGIEDDEIEAHVIDFLNDETTILGHTSDSIIFIQF